jgi:hypothetical protein
LRRQVPKRMTSSTANASSNTSNGKRPNWGSISHRKCKPNPYQARVSQKRRGGRERPENAKRRHAPPTSKLTQATALGGTTRTGTTPSTTSLGMRWSAKALTGITCSTTGFHSIPRSIRFFAAARRPSASAPETALRERASLRHEARPTVWHSAAASALGNAFKSKRSRARSGRLQCRVSRALSLAYKCAITSVRLNSTKRYC